MLSTLDRTLDEEFGFYAEDVPAGPAAAPVKQPNQFASVAAAKLEKDVSDAEQVIYGRSAGQNRSAEMS
jgi:hypothetical protein